MKLISCRLPIEAAESSSQLGWPSGFGSAEVDASVVGVVVDLVAAFVDDYLMVVPAEGDQIVGVGGPSSAPGDDVVDLEAVSAVAAVSGAAVAVAVEDGPT